jgi:hypothetical protein
LSQKINLLFNLFLRFTIMINSKINNWVLNEIYWVFFITLRERVPQIIQNWIKLFEIQMQKTLSFKYYSRLKVPFNFLSGLLIKNLRKVWNTYAYQVPWKVIQPIYRLILIKILLLNDLLFKIRWANKYLIFFLIIKIVGSYALSR